jgi:sugar phosphate isomerase/epimerase
MQRILSTYRYIHQPLAPALLAEIARAGISSIQVFCAPGHFGYRSPEAVRDFANAMADYQLHLHSLHSPTERDLAPGRESGVPISICDTERIRRVDAVDEVKRALEVAERVPFRFLVQHLGQGHQTMDSRRLDAAFNSLEHLAIFAKERGVTIALENTPNGLGSPESLDLLIKETHLRDLKFCFDIGHAHIEDGVEKSFEVMRDRIVTAHIHDNHGEKDEHLLPHEGAIDWDAALEAMAAMPQTPDLVLEPKEQPGGKPSLDKIRETFDKLEENFEEKRANSSPS